MSRPLEHDDALYPPAKRPRLTERLPLTHDLAQSPLRRDLPAEPVLKTESTPSTVEPLPLVRFDKLPTPTLLLSLSSLLLHPPTHKQYGKSVYLSYLGALRCLSSQNLDPDVECRAWTTLAELGLRMGVEDGEVESQVETAITKGVCPQSPLCSARFSTLHSS